MGLLHTFYQSLHTPGRLLVILAVVSASHLGVIVVRALSRRLMKARLRSSLSKAKSVISLGTSALVFVLYFGAIGLILVELGVPLTAYLASASVVGLAIGFGSQSLVQDVVTGVTLIFSDLFDVGDMVEISGQTGLVRSIGMRFTVLENALGARVFIPNRTIANVVNYPRGYVRCLVDVTLSSDPATSERMRETVESVTKAVQEQYPGILITSPSVEGRFRTSSGREFMRVKFRIWPGRGAPLETSFRQELILSLRQYDSAYAEWMVTVNYEVESKSAPRAS